MILYVEHTVDANDLPIALWRFCNNLDPKRDHILIKRPTHDLPAGRQGSRLPTDDLPAGRQGSRLTTYLPVGKAHDSYFACLGLDGTRKTKELDDFQRDWPNIIVANDATIMSVDKKWNDLGIGQLIPSPSLKFKDQMYGEEAVVK